LFDGLDINTNIQASTQLLQSRSWM